MNFQGVQGAGQAMKRITNADEADAEYGAGNWYVGGTSGAYMQKPANQPTQQQMNQDHWSYYGSNPIDAAKNRAAGAGPATDQQHAAWHSPAAPETPAAPAAPAAPASPSFAIGGTPTGQAPQQPQQPQQAQAPAQPRVAPQYGSLTTSASRVQVNPGETAEGIISRLIGNTNTPYMQRAMAIAQQKAAERGLQSSSMAAGAGAQAAIDSALNIAQIDAGNFAANARQDASAQNQLNTQGNDFYYDVQRGFIQQDLSKEMEQLKSQLDLNTRQLLLKATSDIEGSNTGKQALINTTGKYTNLVNQIRVDPDLSAEEKAGAIADLQMDWTEESRRISMIYKIDIPPEYLPTPG